MTRDQLQAPATSESPVIRQSTLRKLAATVGHTVLGLPLWMRYRIRRPQTIIVLGMHRSGTSCITGMLNQCGASLGTKVIAPNEYNVRGFWEAEEGLFINEILLQLGGGSWSEPPELIPTNMHIRSKMRRFLGRLHREGTAVWKDPRMVLTYSAWKPMLGRRQIVAVFRHPHAVVQSLKRRDGFDTEKGLNLWSHYNKKLLAITKKEKHVQWIDFDGGPEHIQLAIMNTARACALRYDPHIADSYSPELRVSDASTTPMNETTSAFLYSELRKQIER